jgi:hypothetical protein
VARAKRTDRAEARRRYRAAMAEAGTPVPDLEPDDDAAPAKPAASRGSATARATGSAASGPAPMQRPGIGYAFRTAFRPADVRGDLKALPGLMKHPAFWGPLLLSAAAVAVIPIFGVTSLTVLFYQYFSGTAPLGTSFIAGFFAPRASYLLGALIALASVGFQAIVFLGPFGNGFFDLQTQTTGAAVSKDVLVQSILTNALFAGVPSGAFFAAAAAWYRRFLRLASPNRQAQSRASSGKRPDGKVPKKNESRPILARRR